jgi:hypothetical protein
VPKTATDVRDLAVDRVSVLTGIRLVRRLVAEILQFYEEIIGPENVAQAKQRNTSLCEVTLIDQIANLAMPAGSKADDAWSVGAQRLQGDEGRVLSLGVGEVGSGDKAA